MIYFLLFPHVQNYTFYLESGGFHFWSRDLQPSEPVVAVECLVSKEKKISQSSFLNGPSRGHSLNSLTTVISLIGYFCIWSIRDKGQFCTLFKRCMSLVKVTFSVFTGWWGSVWGGNCLPVEHYRSFHQGLGRSWSRSPVLAASLFGQSERKYDHCEWMSVELLKYWMLANMHSFSLNNDLFSWQKCELWETNSNIISYKAKWPPPPKDFDIDLFSVRVSLCFKWKLTIQTGKLMTLSITAFQVSA